MTTEPSPNAFTQPFTPDAPPAAAVPTLEELAAQLASYVKRVTELEAEKAQRDAEGWEPKVTQVVKHWLHLANGTVAESTGAIPTHVAMEDGTIVPVTAAYPQQKVSA